MGWGWDRDVSKQLASSQQAVSKQLESSQQAVSKQLESGLQAVSKQLASIFQLVHKQTDNRQTTFGHYVELLSAAKNTLVLRKSCFAEKDAFEILS